MEDKFKLADEVRAENRGEIYTPEPEAPIETKVEDSETVNE